MPLASRVHAQVVVGAVRDALELAPLAALEAEAVLDVDGAGRVVAELLLRVLEEAQVLRRDAEVGVPAHALVDPVLVPLGVLAGLDEELHLHLLELAGPEDEVAGRDLVAEALADLADAERRLLARALLHVRVVDEDALRGLGPQVGQAALVLDRAEVGAEHPVEVAGRREGALVAAVGAGDLGQGLARRRLLEVVGAEALVARGALGERVGERRDVAGGLPDLAGQDHAGVEPDDVVAALDDRLPPLALDVVLQLDAERAVVPGGPQAAVDLAAGEHQSAPLGEADDGVHAVCGLGHGRVSGPAGCRVSARQ